MLTFQVLNAATPVAMAAVPPGTRKLLLHNPAVNAVIIAVKLDLGPTALTFANGIQIPVGGTLQIDLDGAKECPVAVQAIGASGTPQLNMQTLGTGT
jgi:hypothetical protein